MSNLCWFLSTVCLTVYIGTVDSAAWKRCLKGTHFCVCSGTSDGNSDIEGPSEDMERYRKIYENCTRVMGNLEITRISEQQLKADGDFSFLKDIQEISGYLLISHNVFRNLSLPNLKLIRGDEYFYDRTADPSYFDSSGYSVVIFNNPNLEHLDLKNLRSVQKGKILVKGNKMLCPWRSIDWTQILPEGTDTKESVHHDFKKGDFQTLCNEFGRPCSSSCSQGMGGMPHCWGPGPNMCQTMYRSGCAAQCTSGMCYEKGSPQFCCHSACLAGCTGPRNTDCLACTELEDEGKCVTQCPPVEIYDNTKAQTVRNPNGKYRYKNLCVELCPIELYVQHDKCVAKCQEGYYGEEHEEEGEVTEAKKCKPCPPEGCPKDCSIDAYVSSKNIKKFINCTTVHGFIEIQYRSFEESATWGDKGELERFPGISVDDLDALKSVRKVDQYVFIQQRENALSNLSFLSNLEIIHGTKTHGGKALSIGGNPMLKYLGLASLKRVSGGGIMISRNSELCYTQKIPWDVIAPTGGYTIGTNRDEPLCKREERECDQMCEPTKGCWGPGRSLCYECRHWKLEGDCVELCRPQDGFYVAGGKECERCHPECSRCEGPGPTNCTECRNMKLGDKCVPDCPVTHFAEGDRCVPCHRDCYQYGCTGRLNILGDSGCKKCHSAVLTTDGSRVERCLPEYDSSQVDICAESGLEGYYQALAHKNDWIKDKVAYFTCQKCDDACRSCSAEGRKRIQHSCVCRKYKVIENNSILNGTTPYECDLDCPKKTYVLSEWGGGAEAGVCEKCHSECKSGCVGPSPTNCDDCFAVADPIGGDLAAGFMCMKKCPEERPFKNNGYCQKDDPESQLLEERKKRTIIIASVVVPLLFLLILTAACCFSFRRKFRNLKNVFWTPDDLPMDSINPMAKPNMTQLKLIKEDELRRGEPLGSGAFGVVYNGMWYPASNLKVPVAIKELQQSRWAMEKGAEKEMLEEAGIMTQMDHPNLVRLVGVCMSSKRMMLITPLMPLGNLLDYVQNNRARVGSAALLRWCSNIAAGMEYLEENRLVHRDLAARNVLVQTPYHVRVTDFGLAKMLDYGEEEIIVEGRVPVKWLALECIRYRRFTHKSDVWAFGVTVWELLEFGGKPYKDTPIQQIPDLLEKGERLAQPKTCTLEVYMLLIRCWMVDTESRPNFQELREKFTEFSRDPARYLVIPNDKLMRLPSCSSQERQNLIRNMWGDVDEDDNSRMVDPTDYFDSSMTVSTPASPISPSKPLMENAANERQVRHPSVGSHRYHSDPLKHLPTHQEQEVSLDALPGSSYHPDYPVPADMDNYLIPDRSQAAGFSPSSSSVVYTPVVTGSPHNGFFPEQKPRLYYNDLPRIGAKTSEGSMGVDNLEYLEPNTRVSHVNESETTV